MDYQTSSASRHACVDYQTAPASRHACVDYQPAPASRHACVDYQTAPASRHACVDYQTSSACRTICLLCTGWLLTHSQLHMCRTTDTHTHTHTHTHVCTHSQLYENLHPNTLEWFHISVSSSHRTNYINRTPGATQVPSNVLASKIWNDLLILQEKQRQHILDHLKRHSFLV